MSVCSSIHGGHQYIRLKVEPKTYGAWDIISTRLVSTCIQQFTVTGRKCTRTFTRQSVTAKPSACDSCAAVSFLDSTSSFPVRLVLFLLGLDSCEVSRRSQPLHDGQGTRYRYKRQIQAEMYVGALHVQKLKESSKIFFSNTQSLADDHSGSSSKSRLF